MFTKKIFQYFVESLHFVKTTFRELWVFVYSRRSNFVIRRFTVLKGKLNLLNSVLVKNLEFLFTGYT